ncbi:MAG: hypothetical protein ACRCX2_01975, partial [Paraclostridium sp.]
MNTFGTENHHWFKGMSSTDIHSTTIPTQTVSESVKRTKKFKQDCMDALEAEGVVQLAENSKFNDYYKMLKGKLAWADYGIEDNDIISQVRGLGDTVDVPIYVKHYDIIGIIIRKLSGEWLKQKANFKVNSTADEISENDFLRELTRRSEEWLMNTFNKEIEAVLIKEGINSTTGENFQSEEEKQAYLQKVEEAKAKAIPPDVIQRELSKNFKTIASEWAQHTLEKDSRAFFEDEMDLEEAEDFFTTGRYFRHYHVGYDYYKPERWDTREVFFSKDLDIRYPQYGEYVGRVTLMSANKITERFGHLMTPVQIKKINEKLTFSTNDSKAKNWRDTLADGFFGHQRFVPFKNYFDYDLAL